jgi:hypothetical protein
LPRTTVPSSGRATCGPLESVGLLGLAYFLAWSLLVGVRLWLDARVGTSAEPVEPALAV